MEGFNDGGTTPNERSQFYLFLRRDFILSETVFEAELSVGIVLLGLVSVTPPHCLTAISQLTIINYIVLSQRY